MIDFRAGVAQAGVGVRPDGRLVRGRFTMPAVTPRVSLPERFEILTHVANGGMASVWTAEDRVLGRTVAGKLLAEQYLGDARAQGRFTADAGAGAGGRGRGRRSSPLAGGAASRGRTTRRRSRSARPPPRRHAGDPGAGRAR